MQNDTTKSSADKRSDLRSNLIQFAARLFNRMAEKYGGGTTLNELTLLNYGFVCHARGIDICVTQASTDLKMPKSTVSRILTGMRSKGFLSEEVHPSDRRRRVFKLADAYLNHGDTDIKKLLDWCSKPENRLS
jgi:hypothetical protein